MQGSILRIKLLAYDQTKSIRIIALSSNVNSEDISYALSLGFNIKNSERK